jgi:hypothetical protein
LESRGAAAKYETYNRPLYGVCTPDGEYGYQSVDGIRGDLSDADLENHVESFIKTVPTEFDDSDGEVDEAVRQRLEDLGYA